MQPLFYEELATIVQFHRKKAGLTQEELAKYAGIGKTAVFDVEHGKESVQLNTVLKILQILNIKINFTSPLLERMAQVNQTIDQKIKSHREKKS